MDLKVELANLAKTAHSLLKEKPHVELIVKVDENLPRIRCDKRRVRQILLNILSNACKFTETGSVSVFAEQHDDEVWLWVKDTGPGIAPEDHQKVFEMFHQTEVGLRKGGGTGLGMPISRGLAEAHGGRLWLESAVGEGATFFVALPIESAVLQPTLKAS